MIDPTQPDFAGYCRWCGIPVTTSSFRDIQSLQAYYDGASCQKCQDAESVSHSVHHGMIVSAICEDDCVLEAALLPFLFVVLPIRSSIGRVMWEPRFIMRAGPSFDLANPWSELEAMGDAWLDHFVRVLCVPSFTDPLLRSVLTGRKFVIGLDETSLRFVTTIWPRAVPSLVNLSLEVPWQEGFGLPLDPLDAFFRAHSLEGVVGSAGACRGSALRQCGLIARLLELKATMGREAGRSAFDLLLLAHSGLFEEPVWKGYAARSEDLP